MEFADLIPLPLTRDICRTCLAESDNNFVNLHDSIDYELNTLKLIDLLMFLGCIDERGDDSWPQSMCQQCTSTAITAYHFKVTSHKTNKTLNEILTAQHSPTIPDDIDSIDLNVILQDHEYELPMLSHASLDTNLIQDLTITPISLPEYLEKPPKEEKEKPFVCTLCPSAFTKIYGLKYHMEEKHSQPRLKLCQLCGKSFNTVGSLRQHILTHKKARFKCNICDKSYKSKQTVQEHYRIAHSNNRYAYGCSVCKKQFTVKASLTSHMQTHENDRNLFACEHCPKKYTKEKYLKTHSQVHTKEGQIKKFCCTFNGCDRKYATKGSLHLHVSYSHTNNRPFVCDVCSRKFVTMPALRKHMDVHLNTNCGICGKVLLNKSLLRNHIREHNMVK